MDFNSLTLVYFSPTRTTERVLVCIGRGTEACAVERIDLTPPAADAREPLDVEADLAIIGAPVYGGRIPREAVRRLQRLRADGRPAAVVAVYGNREYEDALRELADIASEAGFVPVAGAAFIGEHSYHTEATPIAPGRPDAADLSRARAFGQAIRRKLGSLQSLDGLPPLQVPGHVPYKARGDWPEASPITQQALCTRCAACAAACPVGAIVVDDTVETDTRACILCSACVKRCPTEARVWQHPWVAHAATWLTTHCRERKEPETFV